MYNRAIGNVQGLLNTPGRNDYDGGYAAANGTRASMHLMQQQVEFFKNNDRAPVKEYLRPVPCLKARGPAITSAFVSTFAMLSAIWTIFSLVAGALARSRTGDLSFGLPSQWSC
jgi:hypothetical protein